MLCLLKHNAVDRKTLNKIPKGTVLETVSVSDTVICLVDARDKSRKLDLAPEEFMDSMYVEILEGGV